MQSVDSVCTIEAIIIAPTWVTCAFNNVTRRKAAIMDHPRPTAEYRSSHFYGRGTNDNYISVGLVFSRLYAVNGPGKLTCANVLLACGELISSAQP